MSRSKTNTKTPAHRRAGLALLLVTVVVLLVPIPKALADDTAMYTQARGGAMPLVVVVFDRNLDYEEGLDVNYGTVCINLFDSLLLYDLDADCRKIWNTLAKPILARRTDWTADEVAHLRRSASLWNFDARKKLAANILDILHDSDDWAGLPTASSLLSVNRVEVAQLTLYRALHELVGARVVIMANNDSTCPNFDPFNPGASKDCSNGAYVLLGATKLTSHAVVDEVWNNKVYPRLNYGWGLLDDEFIEYQVSNLDAGVIERDGFGIYEPDAGGVPVSDQCIVTIFEDQDANKTEKRECRVTPPYQAKEVYFEMLRYLSGGDVYNARLDADNLIPPRWNRPAWVEQKSGGDYSYPAAVVKANQKVCRPVTVLNLMFTQSREDDESDDAILSAYPGTDRNGDGMLEWVEIREFLADEATSPLPGDKTIRSRFVVMDSQAHMLAGLVDMPMQSFNTGKVQLTTLAGINAISAAPADQDYSISGPQRVFSPSSNAVVDDLYIGTFRPDPDDGVAWHGNLKKLVREGSTDTVTPVWGGQRNNSPSQGGAGALLEQPSPTNAGGADIFYDTATSTVAALNLGGAKGAVDKLHCADSEAPCEDAFGDADLLEIAKMVAWARGYEVSKNDLKSERYEKFLGFLNNRVASLGESIEKNAYCKIILNDDFVPEIVDVRCSPSYCRATQWDRYGGWDTVLIEVWDDNSGPDETTKWSTGGDPNLADPALDDFDTDDRITKITCDPDAKAPPSRDWLMGDVLHSTPLAIDYGQRANGVVQSDVRVFVGTNQGFLHQVKGSNGSEVWRFAPRAVMDHYHAWARDIVMEDRPYGVDGAPVAWVEDSGDGVVDPQNDSRDHVYLYFGLRRGDRAYYALDVTNPDSKPTLLWKIDHETAGFAELGRTFSMPRMGRIMLPDGSDKGDAPDETMVLVFGGGYDPGYDNGQTPSLDVVGNAIYVMNAKTGSLIWKATDKKSSVPVGAFIAKNANFDDPIPSTVTTLDTNGDGYLDRIYVGDLGGRIWRVNIGDANPAQWNLNLLASLGRHAGEDATDEFSYTASNSADYERRFFHRPDVVRVGAGEDAFYAVVIGSGDRAHPLDGVTDNYLYVLKDDGGTSGPIMPGDLANFAANCSSASDDNCRSLIDASFTQSGWKFALGGLEKNEAGGGESEDRVDDLRAGEKILSTPTTLGGTVLVTSYIPDSGGNACHDFGAGRLYAVNLLTAEPAVEAFINGDSDPNGYQEGINYGRSTRLLASGPPGGVTYIGEGEFLRSDHKVTDVADDLVWRTFWRKRGAGEDWRETKTESSANKGQ